MISTPRLFLFPLSINNLETALVSINNLSLLMGYPIVPDLVQGGTTSAVKIKLDKMREIPEILHPWYTYWLIVIHQQNICAGLVGFKGEPDAIGSVEIGYCMSKAYQSQGYMTEAVEALTDWGFTHRECLRVTARHVMVDNYPSQRVLTKAGFVKTAPQGDGVNYVKERD